MAQALYRRWRSQTFEEVVGQEHVTQTLRNALRDGRVAHAYLFAGPRGTGKTSTARILAKALNCQAPEPERPCNRCPTCVAINEGRMLDLIEIDAASNNSVDDIRELRDKIHFRPSEGRYKVYIIDEVHMLSTSAFNALLKTLEEPPAHARFILATTEPHKIPATVISRCQRFDFRRIPVPQIVAHLRHIAQAEAIPVQDAALAAIARAAQGCMRDAVSLLDQMASYGAETITAEMVHRVLGHVGSEQVMALVDALAAQDVAAGLQIVQDLLLQGASLQEFTGQVVEYLRGVLLLQMTQDTHLLPDRSPEEVARLQRHAQALDRATTLYAIKRLSQAIPELKGGFQPQLPLELAWIEIVQGEIRPTAVQEGPTPDPTQAVSAAPEARSPAPAQAAASGPAPESPPQSEPAPSPEPSPSPPPLDQEAVERLRGQWRRFLDIVRQRCGLKQQAALRSVRDVAVGEQVVVFAFGKNEFACRLIAEPRTLEQVARVLSDFLGRSVGLECHTGEQAVLPANAGRAVSHPERADRPDPLLEYAVNELGAHVVEADTAPDPAHPPENASDEENSPGEPPERPRAAAEQPLP